MSKPIYVLNGPNLDRLGKREPEIYGHTTLVEVEAMCREASPDQPIEFRQSNREYELIEWIHEAIDRGAGIVINPAAFTFTSTRSAGATSWPTGSSSSWHHPVTPPTWRWRRWADAGCSARSCP